MAGDFTCRSHVAGRFSHLGSSWRKNIRRLQRGAPGALRYAAAASVCTASIGGGALGMAAVAMHNSSADSQPPRPPQKQKGLLDFGSPLRRCTDILLGVNLLCFIGQWLSGDALMLWGAKINSLIAAGQWWRLLTSSLLHTGAFHLLINCHALHTIGPHLELVAGPQRFLATYFTAALVGTTASFLLTPAPSVGASAALFGLGAALALFYQRHKQQLGKQSDHMLQQLGITLAINMVYSLLNKRIDNWGHIGGMVGGAAVAWALGPRLTRNEAGQLQDVPPLPWLAYTGPLGALGRRGGSSSSSSGGPDSSSPGGSAGRMGRGGSGETPGSHGKAAGLAP